MSFSSDQSQLVNQLPISLDIPKDPDQFQNISSLYLKRIANILNTKSGGLLSAQEYSNFKQLNLSTDPAKFINIYRKCFRIGAIAAGVTSTTAHNISNLVEFTAIYGTCVTSQPDFRPIPYSSVAGPTFAIDLRVTATDIIIANGPAAPNITNATIFLEYIKQAI